MTNTQNAPHGLAWDGKNLTLAGRFDREDDLREIDSRRWDFDRSCDTFSPTDLSAVLAAVPSYRFKVNLTETDLSEIAVAAEHEATRMHVTLRADGCLLLAPPICKRDSELKTIQLCRAAKAEELPGESFVFTAKQAWRVVLIAAARDLRVAPEVLALGEVKLLRVLKNPGELSRLNRPGFARLYPQHADALLAT